jgi:hypothetical protein
MEWRTRCSASDDDPEGEVGAKVPLVPGPRRGKWGKWGSRGLAVIKLEGRVVMKTSSCTTSINQVLFPKRSGQYTVAMATRMSSCPLEVLQMIVAATDPQDLASLRLASKLWCDLTSKRFGSTQLRHLRCVYSPYSLQCLVDLTAHPVLGPCIRSFEIGTYRMRKYLVNTQPHLEASPANVAALIQFPFQQSGLPRVLLTKALENLSRHGVVPMIGLFEDVIRDESGKEYFRRGYGYDELYGSVDIIRHGRSLVTQTLLDLITVGQRSECLISGISIDLQWNPLNQQVIDRHMGLHRLIKDLAISITDRSTPRWDMTVKLTNPSDKVGSHVVEVCNQGRCLRLEYISMEVYEITDLPQLDRGSYGELAFALNHKYRLHQISLENCFVDTSVFEVLVKNSQSLQHLSVSNTTFYDGSIEDGIELLETFKTGLALETLSLYMLCYENRHSRILVVDEKIENRGSEQIASMLDGLIMTVQGLNTSMERDGNNDYQTS